jgi:hypothetical protein
MYIELHDGNRKRNHVRINLPLLRHLFRSLSAWSVRWPQTATNGTSVSRRLPELRWPVHELLGWLTLPAGVVAVGGWWEAAGLVRLWRLIELWRGGCGRWVNCGACCTPDQGAGWWNCRLWSRTVQLELTAAAALSVLRDAAVSRINLRLLTKLPPPPILRHGAAVD